MKLCRVWLLIFGGVAALSGCFHAAFYKGDGQFTDNGFMAYSRRYVIDLGPVNLAVPNTYTYTLSGLPRAEFNVGIRVFEDKKNEWDVRPSYPVTVRMQLLTAKGDIVILEEGRLDNWVRSYGALDSYSDLYLSGKGREIPLPDGGTRGERLGFKASGGWGTYFESDVHGPYLLTLEIFETEKSMNRPARLIVAGWDR